MWGNLAREIMVEQRQLAKKSKLLPSCRLTSLFHIITRSFAVVEANASRSSLCIAASSVEKPVYVAFPRKEGSEFAIC